MYLRCSDPCRMIALRIFTASWLYLPGNGKKTAKAKQTLIQVKLSYVLVNQNANLI